ncbi:MAG: glycosyltransferase family 2 protein [Polaromonas sp.]|uniref:glycosyltransferase family 2 protein n=1 Tax=Polaromonas sp. TaxID=1869339 RepID=UPI0025D81BD9|nr:glycosyltransferase family 2 protein [Polaromonas sp.]MBI2725082.1 glycosyltransferase family 2 protein [Polaromonas sp.]
MNNKNHDEEFPTITVVMPCLNEEANIADAATSTLRALDRKGIVGELIIVNDGSSDGTQAVAERIAAADSRVRIIRHPERQGIGASFFDGALASTMDYVTMFPGDNENDPDDALTYFSMTRHVDIIVPFIYNIEIRSRMRRIVSSGYRFIINMSFGTNLNYTNGTVIYNTAILREVELESKGFFYQAELLIKLIRRGYLYAETPHFLGDRQSGKTKALTLKSLREVMMAYLRLVKEVHITRSSGATGLPLNPRSATYKRMAAKGGDGRY